MSNALTQTLGGERHVTPRSVGHQFATTVVGAEIGAAFARSRRDWLVLDAPELHLEHDVVVPDVAAWRRDRLRLGVWGPGERPRVQPFDAIELELDAWWGDSTTSAP
jgi:hypothetical protein